MNESRRNDPCPCGSGKKYKKCHLDADAEPQREASRIGAIREMGFRLEGLLVEFDEALSDLDTIDIDDDLFALQMPWAAWTSVRDGRRVADAFLERRGSRLSGTEREWFAAQARAWLSIFEITSAGPGRVEVRDVLTGRTRSVHDDRPSRLPQPPARVLARIVDFRDMSLFAGIHGRGLPGDAAAEVVEAVRKKLRIHTGDIPVESLRTEKAGQFLIDRWADAVESHDERLHLRRHCCHAGEPPGMQAMREQSALVPPTNGER